ncbi:MAG: leucyl aminopeptidase family protein [Geminicoccaceae bacterium]
MLDCFTTTPAGARPVRVLSAADYPTWLAAAPAATRGWLEASGFKGKAGTTALLPGSHGLDGALLVVSDPAEPWDGSRLQEALPAGIWRLDDPDGRLPLDQAALGWALASWRFDRYRTEERPQPLLVVEDTPALQRADRIASATTFARSLISTPAGDLGPAELAEAVATTGRAAGAQVRIIDGDDLLGANYPAIHTVGRASTRPPRLIDLTWGREDAPKVTLVGKGVCFDTGGLDIKPSSNMLMMKKDMGGAAVLTALARLVMAGNLDVRLRLLVPAVENSISGNAFRPGDIIRMRNGKTVEIGNTDAEGRLILADALSEAETEEPDLLIDCATLTGAARVAVGTELPALFTPDDALAADLSRAGEDAFDPLWRLPLHKGYRSWLKSSVADLNNTGSKPFAGAITAALFLQEFVPTTTAWAHLDMFAWNDETRPGRPRGGEATGLRALLTLIERRFGKA